ncbi:serine/threonine protein phosphatase [Altericroceibacterium spongiae]|uniref:Serine/threonine protein phosphatase n=1 Tax=Altericroceibacterium spongiae TaxID=2320269 RepID=A0A420EKF6_9SPHN|nr:metallophosphoesterase family protein [Altericroceibacterium spongiae]RKF21084.1 serine/threonine protein phosphatase [Altericroceibacterium spongiae]
MRKFFDKLLGKASAETVALGSHAAVPGGRRVYAVGDIHGRLDLFEALLAKIDADDAAHGPAQTTLILLGDLVDRGPDSAGVVRLARKLQSERDMHILGGNHEEMFLRGFEETDVLRPFLRHGGKETLLSFGADPAALRRADIKEAQKLMQQTVPQEDRDFIAGFEEHVVIGDYLFVHAGIEPGTPLDEQKSEHKRWIREPFLSHPEEHEHVVVHGHTITHDAQDRGNRIGIDTGAFESGRLTALVLEGQNRRFLQTRVEGDDEIICDAWIPEHFEAA